MTFIASVIAKKGVVLIADSLVTTSRQVLEFEEFYEYLLTKEADDGEINIGTGEVIDLFRSKPSHTKDFQEKLFSYGKFTAIATAGAATLNGKNVEDIITEARRVLLNTGETKDIKKRIEQLANFLSSEAIKCLKGKGLVHSAVFIVTHYSKSAHLTSVYKIYIQGCTEEDLKEPDFNCVSFSEQPKYATVICEVQNRITERILWGDIDTVMELI